MPFKKNKTAVKENRLFNALNVIFMILFSILIVFPIWDVIVGSFSSSASLASLAFALWPENFSLDAYRVVFNDPSIWNSFMISVLKTVIGVTTSVFFTAMVAYAMSKQDLIGRKLFIALGVGTMFFSGGMIPFYLLIRSLGLLDNFLVYIIPALFSFYNMLILMNFFREIPVSLEESARIDGAGVWRIFLQIILPLSTPVLATIALFNGVYQWNDFMTARLYISNEALYPIQMKLYEIIVQQQAANMQNVVGSVIIPTSSQTIQLATIVVATVPIVLVYPFLQRYLISGMMIGAVKE
ncbi:LOW QUALITY PROTEIN: binding-protein-dependent transport systems inner membrane component [Bacillus sp. JCM 19046]|nr:LOW QUALITY PROTEIN: binding-protein-dependent transport systems inner membrane component [Bacillus sp. JCM 19045]GAF20312.1 LOW QUALITY PROTEIN: binding-protein-dependent transport systems inner membrane component [Bacillus sp. JCM 19046]